MLRYSECWGSGDAVRREAAHGEAVRGEAVRGEAVRGDAVRGDVAFIAISSRLSFIIRDAENAA